MKRSYMRVIYSNFGIVFLSFILISLAFSGCNTSLGPEEGIIAKEVVINLGGDYVYKLDSGEGYKGTEIDLSGNGLLDISKYSNVTVNAKFYKDDAGTSEATTGDWGDGTSKGQFILLKAGTSGWGESNYCAPPRYDMPREGDSVLNIPSTASGIPGKLLIQTGSPGTIKSVKVFTITFTPKQSDVTLELAYSQASPKSDSSVAVAGNKVIFTNADNGTGAALYRFRPGELSNISSKTVYVSYTVVGYSTDPDIEQQLCIQAASDNDANWDSQSYQTLTTPSGTFNLSGNDLSTWAAEKPLTLTGFRIVNNGFSTYDDKIRQETYTLVINSVTVK